MKAMMRSASSSTERNSPLRSSRRSSSGAHNQRQPPPIAHTWNLPRLADSEYLRLPHGDPIGIPTVSTGGPAVVATLQSGRPAVGAQRLGFELRRGRERQGLPPDGRTGLAAKALDDVRGRR
jgi:hypothetical protein